MVIYTRARQQPMDVPSRPPKTPQERRGSGLGWVVARAVQWIPHARSFIEGYGTARAFRESTGTEMMATDLRADQNRTALPL